jgi:hypothetical protein
MIPSGRAAKEVEVPRNLAVFGSFFYLRAHGDSNRVWGGEEEVLRNLVLARRRRRLKSRRQRRKPLRMFAACSPYAGAFMNFGAPQSHARQAESQTPMRPPCVPVR